LGSLATMEPHEQKALVRKGYDVVSHEYRADDDDDERYRPWIAALREAVPHGGEILDLGCGAGVPVSRELSKGYCVTGVDFSDVQIKRARKLAPRATFVHADVSDLEFAPASFDAVVCLYMLIHLPLREQRPVLAKIASWLKPGGLFLSTLGHERWTGLEENWLGSDAPMWWSHADSATYRRWIEDVDLQILDSGFIEEGSGGHSLFWARTPN
jgi:2-polyprenyl-3-methyl-5-hydroxy-6-metoxy-1,4-benzoquinol methylase